MAKVRIGIDWRLCRPVAIKQLRPEYLESPTLRERLRREAVAAAQVEDPRVVKVYQYEPGGHGPGEAPYIALQLLDGGTLQEFSERFGPLEPEVATLIVISLAQTLQAVHDTGTVHRDVKPGNVMIVRENPGQLVLFDFGLAAVHEPEGTPPLTPPGMLLGTLGYGAPEQLRGEPVDERADIFSLGVVFYELVSGGRLPFVGRSVKELLSLIEKKTYVPLGEANPRIRPDTAAAIARCLCFDPEERWESMAALARELARTLVDDLFQDATVELRDLFADPEGYVRGLPGRMRETLRLKAASLAAAGDEATAVAALERALLWDPGNAKVEEQLRGLRPKGEGRGPALRVVGPEEEPAAPGEDPAEREPWGPEVTPVPEVALAPAVAPASEVAPGPEGAPVIREGFGGRLWGGGAVAVGLLVVLLLLVPRARLWGKAPGLEEVLPEMGSRGGQKAERPVPVWLTHPLLAQHRPYPVEEGAGARRRPDRLRVDLEVLQRLKARGDLQGVATAWAIDGSPGSLEQAAATLEGLLPAHALGGVVGPVGPSQAPDIDSDRAAVKVLQGRPEEALRLAERVLRARPDHTAAEWNRALALVALGLTEEGASSFERIAGWGIAGWSGEASERAAALRRGDEPVERGYKEVVAAGRAMVAGGPVIVELARRFPGYMRLFFYDAVRAAQSAERVRALLPLAVELDLQHGGHALESYAERIARGAFVRRGALARTYAQLAANPQAQEAGAQVAYLAEVRDAGEEDLLLGALFYTGRVGEHIDEYRALARRSGDPWFVLIGEQEQAKVEVSRGEQRQAGERLLAALRMCQRQGLEYRCVQIEHALARHYVSLSSLPDAEAHARAGWTLARKTGDWGNELLFLNDIGEIFSHLNDPTLSRAFIEEAARHSSGSCPHQRYVSELRAMAHYLDLRFEEARHEILAAPLCGEPRTLRAAAVLAALDRVGMPVETSAQLREDLAALRRSKTLSRGGLAFSYYVEGLSMLSHDRQQGVALFREAIAIAELLPIPDANARLARFHSYEELSLDAGKAGDAEEVFKWLSEESGLPRPNRCAVGALVSDERSLVVMYGPNGVARIRYQDRRTSSDMDVAHLVPEDFRAALVGCSQVDVFAHPLLEGRPELLSSELAWGFRHRRLVSSTPDRCEPSQLVIGDVVPPQALGLPQLSLSGIESLPARGRTILRGLAATPSTVLTEMPRATEILLHVHALNAGGTPQLVLSPDDDRKYALTIDDLSRIRLPCGPLVVFGSLSTVGSSPDLDGAVGLPSMVLERGASAVLAVGGTIPDAGGSEFFAMVSERIRARVPPAVALHDVRSRWLSEKRGEWVKDVVAFY